MPNTSYRSFSRDVTSFPVAIFVYSPGLYYICKYKPHQQFLLLKMNTTAAEANLNANPDVGIHPPLSEYAKKLEPRVRQRYLEKFRRLESIPFSLRVRIFNQTACLQLNLQISYSIWFWRRAFTHNNSLRLSEAWKCTSRWFRDL